jgi:hypothetical protein
VSSTSITESQLYAALRTFLLGIAGNVWQVVKAQDNRVAMPTGNFITMTSLTLPILSTSKESWIDPGSNPGTQNNLTSTGWRVQLDVYGPGAQDMALMISRLVRTDYACDQFAASGVDVQPLYAEEPRNTTLINAEQQYEERWTLDVHAQFNPIVTTPLDFADDLKAGLVEVDTTFR